MRCRWLYDMGQLWVSVAYRLVLQPQRRIRSTTNNEAQPRHRQADGLTVCLIAERQKNGRHPSNKKHSLTCNYTKRLKTTLPNHSEVSPPTGEANVFRGGLRGVPLVTQNTRAQVLTHTHTLAGIRRHKQTIASTVRPTPSEGRLYHPPGLKSARPVFATTGLTMGYQCSTRAINLCTNTPPIQPRIGTPQT